MSGSLVDPVRRLQRCNPAKADVGFATTSILASLNSQSRTGLTEPGNITNASVLLGRRAGDHVALECTTRKKVMQCSPTIAANEDDYGPLQTARLCAGAGEVGF